MLLTDQLATIYSTTPKIIRQNFTRNEEYFDESEDFFKLEGEELKAFRTVLNEEIDRYTSKRSLPMDGQAVRLLETPNDPTLDIPMPMINKFASKIYLWTLMGMTSHAKLLTTSEAGAVHKRMRKVYFAYLNGELNRDKSKLMYQGRRVWSVKAIRRELNDNSELLSGADYFSVNEPQRDRLCVENGRNHGRGTTLIFESGMERLAKAFEENAARFTEGKHYFTLNGKKLWTRRGLAHFAFIIETPEAWAIYKEMERVYLTAMGIK